MSRSLGPTPRASAAVGLHCGPEHQGILNFLHNSANQNIREPGYRTCGLGQTVSTFEPQFSSLHSKQLGLLHLQFSCLPLELPPWFKSHHPACGGPLQLLHSWLGKETASMEVGLEPQLGSQASGIPSLTPKARDHLAASHRGADQSWEGGVSLQARRRCVDAVSQSKASPVQSQVVFCLNCHVPLSGDPLLAPQSPGVSESIIHHQALP